MIAFTILIIWSHHTKNKTYNYELTIYLETNSNL